MILTAVLITMAFSQVYAQAVIQICPDGYAHDKLYPNFVDFTCKRGPAKHPKCDYFKLTLTEPVECPGSGYVAGWYGNGDDLLMKCCKDCERDIYRTNCIEQINDAYTTGNVYRVSRGRVIVGYTRLDDGSYITTQCKYRYKY